jgi:3-hydroxybutyryl-CoA dehydrogenase
LSDIAACDLVIEAIVEDVNIKQQLFKQIENLVKPECIIASNTSSLSITSLASCLQNPSRFIGIHFFNPAPVMPLVEIIPGIATDKIILQQTIDIISNWKKLPVTAKDTPGFIVNRIARPFYGEAIRMYEEGIAGFETIDVAMKTIGGFKMGPFELMDMIGNDINFKVTESVWTQMFFDARYRPSLTQKRLFEAGYFGKKSGQGYYNYAATQATNTPSTDNELMQKIFSRILVMLINEAAEALYLKIASRDDIDTAMTKGVNYPKGLLKWADEVGPQKCVQMMDDLFNAYHEERYRCSILLRKMALEGKLFFQ